MPNECEVVILALKILVDQHHLGKAERQNFIWKTLVGGDIAYQLGDP